MIEVRHLTKKYGPNTAVDDISFTVEKGRIYGFLGPNGAGKSTTMNIICGCLAATDGEVIVDGHDIYEEPLEARKRIGYLPEIPPLYNDMTPKEYLSFVGRAKKIPSAKLSEAVGNVMTKTALHGVADRLIRNLSKGYRQRVGIAQAILGDPEIIILDEPTVGLDPMQIIEIRDLLRELGKDPTVILSSHVLPEISATCDYVIVIAHGKIVASDTMENLNRSFSETEVIKLEARAPLADVKEIVSTVRGIENVSFTETPSSVKCDVEVKSGSDIREDIFRAFSSAGIPLLRLESNSLSLEDIFIKLVNEEHMEFSSEDAENASEGAASSADGARSEEEYSPYYETAPKRSKKKNREETGEYSSLFGDGSGEKEDK